MFANTIPSLSLNNTIFNIVSFLLFLLLRLLSLLGLGFRVQSHPDSDGAIKERSTIEPKKREKRGICKHFSWGRDRRERGILEGVLLITVVLEGHEAEALAASVAANC